MEKNEKMQKTEKNDKKKIVSVNQEIYKQIRYRLDSNMREYNKRKESEENQRQSSERKKQSTIQMKRQRKKNTKLER